MEPTSAVHRSPPPANMGSLPSPNRRQGMALPSPNRAFSPSAPHQQELNRRNPYHSSRSPREPNTHPTENHRIAEASRRPTAVAVRHRSSHATAPPASQRFEQPYTQPVRQLAEQAYEQPYEQPYEQSYAQLEQPADFRAEHPVPVTLSMLHPLPSTSSAGQQDTSDGSPGPSTDLTVAPSTSSTSFTPGSDGQAASAGTGPRSMKRRNVKGLALPGGGMRLGVAPRATVLPAGGANGEGGDPEGGHGQVVMFNPAVPTDGADDDKIDNEEFVLDERFSHGLRPDNLLVLRELGSGNGGTVSKVQNVDTGVNMARKVVYIDCRREIRRRIIRELQILSDCKSDHVVKFHGSYLSGTSDVMMCMEYMDAGSLDAICQSFGPIRVDVLGKISMAVLSGLDYLYVQHHIMHRDIKPSNVLVNSKGEVKICDFGVSSELVNSIANTFVGTSTYMAPERIQGGAYSIKSDIWSFGLTILELATGNYPFAQSTRLEDNSNQPLMLTNGEEEVAETEEVEAAGEEEEGEEADDEEEDEDEDDEDEEEEEDGEEEEEAAERGEDEADGQSSRDKGKTVAENATENGEENAEEEDPEEEQPYQLPQLDLEGDSEDDDDSPHPLGIVELLQRIVHEPSPRLPKSDAFPSILDAMIQKCLIKKPDDRPTPGEILEDDSFIRAASRTPVDVKAWAVSLMERSNRKSHLAPALSPSTVEFLQNGGSFGEQPAITFDASSLPASEVGRVAEHHQLALAEAHARLASEQARQAALMLTEQAELDAAEIAAAQAAQAAQAPTQVQSQASPHAPAQAPPRAAPQAPASARTQARAQARSQAPTQAPPRPAPAQPLYMSARPREREQDRVPASAHPSTGGPSREPMFETVPRFYDDNTPAPSETSSHYTLPLRSAPPHGALPTPPSAPRSAPPSAPLPTPPTSALPTPARRSSPDDSKRDRRQATWGLPATPSPSENRF